MSAHFINNPILYFQELDVLRSLGCEPIVHVDPNGMVTTPFDMMINQIVEESRGNGRHGSCGVGINETIKRHERYFPITVGDLNRPHYLKATLRGIQKFWVPDRLQELGVEPSSEWLERLESPEILDTYIEHCAEYVKAVNFTSPKFFAYSEHIVFEGAQGLLLDEDHYFFPYVTHSHQVSDRVLFVHKARTWYETKDELLRWPFAEIGAKIRLSSFGPTAADVRDETIDQETIEVMRMVPE